jgi:uncharacterized repeat protein (TIGR01451 family)
MLRSLAGRAAQLKGRARTTLLVLIVLLAFVPGLAGGSASAKAAPRADMVIVAVSDDPDPVFTNQILFLHVAVENRGPSLATGVEVTTALPSDVRFELSLSISGCVESGGMVTCSFSSWPANAAGAIILAVTPSTAGVLQLTFTVTTTERDPDLSNNSATETTQVVEPTEADASIALPDAVEGYAGQNIWLGGIEVRNAGPATATGLTVTLEFPRGLSPTLGGGECTETSGGLTCSYSWGTLPPGNGLGDIIGVTAAEAGTFTVRGSVTADQTDPVPENNSDATVVTANPAADLHRSPSRPTRRAPGPPSPTP